MNDKSETAGASDERVDRVKLRAGVDELEPLVKAWLDASAGRECTLATLAIDDAIWPHLDVLIAAARELLARDEAKGDHGALLKAAAALLAKLDAINEHPSYNAAFGMAYAHGHKYDGPNWTQEAFALRRLLAPAPPVEPSAEERQRAYDHGPDGDATTPGFFGGATK